MNKVIVFLTIFLFSISTISFADGTAQVITLKDGSQIKGELAGIDNGIYTVKTPIIGDVHVAASDVASITNAAAAPVAPLPTNLTSPTAASGEPSNLNQQIAAGQQQLMSNPQSMAIIQQMAQDPEIMQALQDPALVQAVTSHDYQAVQNNPKIQELMSNPKMKALLQQIVNQQHQSAPSQ